MKHNWLFWRLDPFFAEATFAKTGLPVVAPEWKCVNCGQSHMNVYDPNQAWERDHIRSDEKVRVSPVCLVVLDFEKNMAFETDHNWEVKSIEAWGEKHLAEAVVWRCSFCAYEKSSYHDSMDERDHRKASENHILPCNSLRMAAVRRVIES